MLPAYPWSQRPDDMPLSVDEVCAALVHSEGDIPDAAARLKVGTLILRKFIDRSTRAKAVIREMIELLNDEAQRTLRAAIRDPDSRRQDWATRYVLNSQNAKAQGLQPCGERRRRREHPRHADADAAHSGVGGRDEDWTSGPTTQAADRRDAFDRPTGEGRAR